MSALIGLALVAAACGFVGGAFSVFLLCPSARPVYTHKEHRPS